MQHGRRQIATKVSFKTVNLVKYFEAKISNFCFLIPYSCKFWPAMLPLSKPYSARTFVAQGKIAFPQNFCAQR